MLYTTQLAARSIRLLTIELDTYRAPITCRLVDVPLDDAPPFEALSYVWGDSGAREVIVCNGQAFRATVNLVRALRRIRLGLSPPGGETVAQDAEGTGISTSKDCRSSGDGSVCRRYRPAYLWVDAICIDQSSIAERNEQVQLMKEMYSKAERVIIWLGDVKASKRSMCAISAAIHFIASKIGIGPICEDAWKASDNLTSSAVDSAMQALGWPRSRHVLSAAFSSDWFTRVWCVQEADLARESVLLYRNAEIGGRHMAVFCLWYIASHEDSISNIQVVKNVREAALRLIPSENKYVVPSQLLHRSKTLRATDPRDKFYGLLGLMKKTIVEIDYNKSVTEVYIDSVLHTAADGLFVLFFVFHGSEFMGVGHLPSWVPDWSVDNNVSVRFENAQASKQQIHIPDFDLARAGILRLHGFLCDRVVSFTEVLQRGSDGKQLSATTRLRIQQFFSDVLGRAGQEALVDEISSTAALLPLAKTLTGGFLEVAPGPKTEAGIEDRFIANFKAFILALFHGDDNNQQDDDGDDNDLGDASAYDALLASLVNKRTFHTDKHWLGLGPACLRDGDVIVVFHGGLLPFVLRPIADRPDYYHLMGACYIYDLENEGAYAMAERGEVEERVFNLV